MTSLIGVYECNIDTKGRLLLPVAFKKQMQSILRKGFVVKRSVFHKCLELYSMNEWNDLVKDVNKLNRFKKKMLTSLEFLMLVQNLLSLMVVAEFFCRKTC